MKKRILTGITTTGTPHVGNYIGAIRPALKLINKDDESFFFLADYHSIIKNKNKDEIKTSVENIALAWLSCCLLYTSPSPRDSFRSRMPSSA